MSIVMENYQELYPTKDLMVLQRYDTEYCSDSVEWCPHEPYQNLFVCANYHLVKTENLSQPHTRFGRILLFSLEGTQLERRQTITTAAVLDQKWCHVQIDGHPILAVVNAVRTIDIFQLTSELNLKLISTYTLEDDEDITETLILSVDWSTGRTEGGPVELVCSDSKGKVHVLKYAKEKLILIDSYHLHEYEAWIAAFDYWNVHIVFTGGDDGVFHKLDRRVGVSSVIKNRSHEAGVTCIHSNASREHMIATGSYDSKLRLWDTRCMKRPKAELQMPGTLWRLKWDPFHHDYLLAACMQGGVHVVNSKNEDKLEIVESFYEHEQIAYGADWCHLNKDKVTNMERGGNTVIGTCSFYDHLLCVSTINLN